VIYRSPSQQIVQPVQIVIRFGPAATPAAVDTLLTLVTFRDGVPDPGATSIPVTAGRILRIRTVVFSMRTTLNGSPACGVMSLRTNPAGATVLASPALIVFELEPANNVAVTVGNTRLINLPASFQFQGAQTIGVSAVGCLGFVTNITNISLIGDELPDWITE